jgi:Zn-finger nucleic acid-binding protein
MLQCPRCLTRTLSSSRLHRCSVCAGVWIEEATLAEHVSTMQSSVPRQLAWSESTERRALPCAECRAPMVPRLLFGVPVNRCRRHGVWFDARELSLVLERAALAMPVVAPSTASTVSTDSSPSFLEGLDGDDVVAVMDLAETATSGVVELASEAADSGVIDGVLEVLGELFSAIDFD